MTTPRASVAAPPRADAEIVPISPLDQSRVRHPASQVAPRPLFPVPTVKPVTRYWYDTEFIEDGRTIDLISIGMVCEDGREFYAESADCDLSKANEWVRANVIPHLRGSAVTFTRGQIAMQLIDFVTGDQPELWGYYSDYDHVALCQLYGRMIDLPKGWPMMTLDVKQLAVALGDPELPAQIDEHFALADARWNRDAWRFLQ